MLFPTRFYQSFRPPRQQARGFIAIKSIVFGVLTCLLPGHFEAAAAPGVVYSGVVTRVVDGDTVWVSTGTGTKGAAGSKLLKVRIVGIDAPEICQTGGPEALQALRGHVLGQRVTLTSPSSRSHDDYGRLLARLDKQGEDVGRWMVYRGHAWSNGYRRHAGPYAAEQARAQASGTGLFARRTAENPRSFRKRHGSC